MPWKECSVMDERLRFVGKLLDGEATTDTRPGVWDLPQEASVDSSPVPAQWRL